MVYYQTTHDVMALQPAEKELQEGRPLQELPSWLLPRLVSTGVFSKDEINQVLPLGDEGKFSPKLKKWKLQDFQLCQWVGCIWGAFMRFFLLVFLESFKQVWIASTQKNPSPSLCRPVGGGGGQSLSGYDGHRCARGRSSLLWSLWRWILGRIFIISTNLT